LQRQLLQVRTLLLAGQTRKTLSAAAKAFRGCFCFYHINGNIEEGEKEEEVDVKIEISPIILKEVVDNSRKRKAERLLWTVVTVGPIILAYGRQASPYGRDDLW
jgi:hypothetical protein